MNNFESLKKTNTSQLKEILEIEDEKLRKELTKIFFQYETNKLYLINNHKLNKKNEQSN